MRAPRCAAVVTVAIGAAVMSAPAVMFAAHRDNHITSALSIFTQLGSPLALLIVMTIVAGGVAASGRSAVPLGVGALAIGGFGLSVVIAKLVVGRPRPPLPVA